MATATLKHLVLGLASLERTIARQRSRIKWLQEGDASSKLFHLIANGRKGKNFIPAIQKDGVMITGQKGKEEAFFDAFSAIMGRDSAREHTVDLEYLIIAALDLSEQDLILQEEERLSLYADDVVLFIKPTFADLSFVVEALRIFGEASGLKVNFTKSSAILIRSNDEDEALVRSMEEDTVDHILIHCVYARQVWFQCFTKVEIPLELSPNGHERVEDWWVASRKRVPKAQRKDFDSFVMLPKIDSPQPKIAHTSDFKFLDKAAIVTQLGMEERLEAATSWKLCTVTQVEEVKILLRLLPVRITIVIVSSAFSQMNTTFVQQGSAMEMTILSVPVPAASLASLEVICVMTWVILYNKVIVPAMSRFVSSSGDGEPSQQQQRMGAGRLLMTLTMAVAALVEMKRLDSAARGVEISISWQLPQYFFLAGGEVFCYIVQLEFFFDEAPDTMKSMCTSLALLTIALGSYMSSFIYAIVEAFTATGDSPGWISDDLNKGHLDYFFWAMAAMCTLNFVVYSGIVKNYRLKTIIS
ncbi:protein NRT1/ PTR FAMILY 8.3-like [Triticum aestivum]|uniref:protein NRT1/ PTR FAMILY 8.3-like n=1 Tax=Triticum aestivum TaxID=4565 RepID=UPI001D002978|nr:protein NRT1/ PTR FAMILY 8.3-like [Triticum aestivum]